MARHQLDVRGMRCPWPALRLARVMRQSAPGDEVVMILDDPKAESEVAALSQEHHWSLTRTERAGDTLFMIRR